MSEQPQSCPICSSANLKPKPFGYRFSGQWLGGIECGDCGIILIYPQPSSEEIKNFYSKEYFDGGYRCGHEGSYFDDETLTRLSDDTMLHRIKEYKSEGKFLEIGCAGGAFLNNARNFGYDVQGVEVSGEAADFARKKFNLNVITGNLEDANFQPEIFDIVFMGDVLEHLPDPTITMRHINRIIKKGGLLVILCPMQTNTLFSRFGFLAFNLIGRKATVNLPPYHLFEYRVKSLANLVKQFGFQPVTIKELAVPPAEIFLRGSILQRVFKKIFQYPNYILTKLFNKYGDRIELYAIKETKEIL